MGSKENTWLGNTLSVMGVGMEWIAADPEDDREFPEKVQLLRTAGSYLLTGEVCAGQTRNKNFKNK